MSKDWEKEFKLGMAYIIGKEGKFAMNSMVALVDKIITKQTNKSYKLMSKDWKEDFVKKFEQYWVGDNYKYGVGYLAWESMQVWLKEELHILLAKQRTQLLARVREEVTKTRFPHTNRLWKTIGYSQIMYIVKKLKEEQLKKLEIISEEGK